MSLLSALGMSLAIAAIMVACWYTLMGLGWLAEYLWNRFQS